MGRAFARKPSDGGYTVTAVARGEDRLRTLIDELGPGHSYLAADLATSGGREPVADELTHRPSNLLVNNAGTAHHGPFTETAARDALTGCRAC